MTFNNARDNEGGTQPAWLTEDIEADQQPAVSSDWATATEADQSTGIDGPPKNEPLPADATTTATTSVAIDDNATQQHKRWSWGEMIKRDGRLLIITLAIIILMNIPFIKWLLYPFSIFSTYVHEFCHGFSALLVGGRVQKLLIFPDASGLAWLFLSSPMAGRHFVGRHDLRPIRL